jgi:FKBP-type peptidyl-prolyl cis-trans isomerase FkpA/FKBP-type peptidyl-prolyl cis-trans isomerase FklB
MKNILVIAALGLGLTACQTGGNVALDNQDSKISYVIGQQIGQELKAQGIKVNPQALAMSIQDVLDGKESRLSEEEIQAVVMQANQDAVAEQEKEASVNKETGEAFLKANSEKEGVKVTESGLQYRVITEGKGASPKSTDQVVVHYKGTLIDGTEFDSSYARKEPARFPVTGVIPGWVEALQMMKPGAKWELVIPSNLAYGDRGNPRIPANSVLIFEVELLEIAGS